VLRHLVVKELLQLLRDKKMIPMIFVAPAVQLIALGYAANLDVTDVPTVLVDLDRSAGSRELSHRFTASGYFRIVAAEEGAAAAEPHLESGRARLALVVGDGYGEAVAAGRTPEVQLLVDGSDSVAGGLGLGYATRLLGERSEGLVREKLEQLLRQRGPPPVAVGRTEASSRVFYNPDLRSRWFYVPAVLAMVLMILTMVLSSMGIVREKEIGTMEQLIVTPLRPWQLIVGKLFPFALIGFVDVFLIAGLAVAWFRVPLRGSFVLLVLLTMFFLMNTLGLGLLTSTLVRTQQQAMMTAAFVFMVPQIFLSGLLFPIENMPRLFQLATYAVPLRYYAPILRGVFLKGAGIASLWPQALALAGFGMAFLALAALRFRKRLD